MSRIALLILLASGLAWPTHGALAQTEDSGWFTTFHFGAADYDTTLTGDGPWWGEVDDDGHATALGVGYNVMPQIGLRFTYERNGGIDVANRCPEGRICPAVVFNESARADNWSLVAVPRLHFGDGWELYGTAGAMHWSIRPEGVIGRDSGTDFLYGGGFGFRFDNGLGLAVEYQESGTDYEALRLNASFEF